MDALVTDVHARGPVAGLRALGSTGLRIAAVGPSRTAAGLASRFAAVRAVAPDAATDPEGFRDAVGELARTHGPLVVYPGQEESIDALLGEGERLPAEALLPYPEGDAVDVIRDKVLLPAVALHAPFTTPATIATGQAGDLIGDAPPLPCVVKATDKVAGSPTAWVIDSRSDYETALRALPPEQWVVVQEHRDGTLTALALVVGKGGELVACFQQEALRTWPSDAGPSRLAVSVAPDMRLAHEAAEALAATGFWGLVQLQFVAGALVDVNPRFYGSLPLALACGVNLPAAWHAVATDAPLPPLRDYPAGVRFRWLEAEVLAAIHGEPGGLLERVHGQRVGAMWWRGDPWPSVLLGAAAAGGWLRRRLPAAPRT